MLQEMASEYLHLRLKHRLSEKTWIAEKEELIGWINLGIPGAKFDSFRKKSSTSQSKSNPLPSLFKSELFDELNYDKLEGSRKREWELRRTIEELEVQFDQQHKLSNRYRDQVLYLFNISNIIFCRYCKSRRLTCKFARNAVGRIMFILTRLNN